ncbi:MAG TPA: aminopeptidase [Candidatus Methanofastidiosa archaeon]|nr:aminopeptidase [Candidatus Methanofastidiosa archaeon]HPR41233.1 aminopeptidase [Candidatus Methanofastidiosa archaeon]
MLTDEELTLNRKSVWNVIGDDEKDEIEVLSREYRDFIDNAKTEREVVELSERMALKDGFVPIEDLEASFKKDGKGTMAGKRVYVKNKEKNIVLFVIGKRPLSEGFRMIGSHVDSPRLDLKPNPLIETKKFAMLKTHYYGGIKKYHFANIPLALHGVVYKRDGSRVDITIGENEDEPVFTVNDILIHLSKKVQYERKTPDVIKGEELNILFSSIPDKDTKMDTKTKMMALKLLYEKYGITEEDFVSAEIEAVPAGKSRNVGIDMSMIGAYGQDDRICVFCSLKALMEMDVPEYTSIVFLADKEETHSEGNTAMQSNFFPWALSKMMSIQGETTNQKLMDALMGGKTISSDVGAALNPNFPKVHEENNAPRLGNGLYIQKYSGTSGKYEANDANAEFVSEIRKIFNDNNIVWQSGELGKVDEGGGGTIAKYMARLGMEVVDVGPALLSMHSSFEIASKADLWMTKKGFKAFYEAR